MAKALSSACSMAIALSSAPISPLVVILLKFPIVAYISLFFCYSLASFLSYFIVFSSNANYAIKSTS